MEQLMTQIATGEQMMQKIRRIAYEIAEDNYDEQEIILAGICRDTEGYALAEKLFTMLKPITTAGIRLTHIELNKSNPGESPVQMQLTRGDIDNKVIILTDDVSNTGRTFLYAIKPFLDYSPKKIRCAVLVERRHKFFPVAPDYVGLSLSTTFQEHIKVVLRDENNKGIYLM